MTRLLLTGSAGYLGALVHTAARAWEVLAVYHVTPPAGPGPAQQLDLRDAAATRAMLEAFRPEVIVHTACSNRTPEHIAAILPAAQHLAAGAHRLGARLVHLSSDVVFDGEHAPYDDASPPTPLSDYARAKADAEAAVADLCPGAVIVRPSLIWGLDPLDHQTRWLVDGVRAGRPVTLFTDEYRCPTYVHDLVAALLELAARPEISGPINLVGPQALSRWDFGQRLLRALGVAPGPTLTAGTVRGSGLVRPRDLTIHPRRAVRELRTRLRPVDEVLGL